MKNELQTKETNNLQTTTFNFYGDELIAIKDGSTGDVYTSINEVLRGIGFTKNSQIQYQRDKWVDDRCISKGVVKFTIPFKKAVAKKDTPLNNQETYCINTRKLPIALAKINITKRLLRDYPNITERLEIYQDKCADVLASVFIDKQQPDIHSVNTNNILSDILTTLNHLTIEVNNIKSGINTNFLLSYNNNEPEPIHYAQWFEKLKPKYTLLKIKYNETKNSRIYSIIYNRMKIKDSSIDFDKLQNDYCNNHNVEKCYLQQAIFENYKTRKLYEKIIDEMLIR
jgi:hypothetical protein